MKKVLYLIILIFAVQTAKASIPNLDWINKVGARTTPKGKAVYNVANYGAVGDAVVMCTESIQKALDECAANGGGIVTFNPGVYLTGSLFVKSNTEFNIPKGTTIIGSNNLEDYRRIDTRVAGVEMEWPAALINVISARNVAITGTGTIDGRGKIFWEKYWKMVKDYEDRGLRWIVDYDCERPRGILVSDCSDITLQDFVLYRSGFWSIHILYSNHITARGLVVSNNIEGRGPSTDGIDIDSSEYVLVEDSYINCNDDNFCLKAGRDSDGLKVNRPCQYVVIRNCIAGHGEGLFTCGSETSGGIRNIAVYDMKGIGTYFGFRFKSTSQRGGTVENIYIDNVEMTGVVKPFVADLDWFPAYSNSKLPNGYTYETLPIHWKKMLEQVDPEKGTPYFKNINFSNVQIRKARICIEAQGLSTSILTNFNFKNVSFEGDKAGIIKNAQDWSFENCTITAPDKLESIQNKNVELPKPI